MNETKLKRLLELFQQSEIDELELRHSFWRGTRIRISRHRPADPLPPTQPPPIAAPGLTVPSAPLPDAVTATASPQTDGSGPAVDGPVVVSPMVGTFYRASSAAAEPLVSPGDHVRVGQTVCIIEAMKIMNEIHAEVEGRVVEILAENGDPVEYNQPLIRLRPS